MKMHCSAIKKNIGGTPLSPFSGKNLIIIIYQGKVPKFSLLLSVIRCTCKCTFVPCCSLERVGGIHLTELRESFFILCPGFGLSRSLRRKHKTLHVS